jgi:four helix bundle protein
MKTKDKSAKVKERAYAFSLDIIRLYQQIKAQNEFVLSKQVLRSGTSIGANIEEASAAQSRKDFIAKMSVASKEARETLYWLRLLRDSNICTEKELAGIIAESQEIIKMLTAIVKTTQTKKQY